MREKNRRFYVRDFQSVEITIDHEWPHQEEEETCMLTTAREQAEIGDEISMQPE